jgi:hypothetical protein
VEVVLHPDKRAFELAEQVRALSGVIAMRFEEREEENEGRGERGNGRIGNKPATELFEEYYKNKHKADPDPQLMALFDRLYQEESTAKDET